MQESDEKAVAEDRAEELLGYSSSSAGAELELAEAWLKALHFPNEPERWRIDAAAGADGAMANAWGRLTLWARADDTYDEVRSDLDAAMDDLVRVRRCLVTGTPDEGDERALWQALDRLKGVLAIVRSDSRP